MEYKELCKNINRIYSKLQDEESRILMDGRLAYSITKDRNSFYKAVDSLISEWHCGKLEHFLSKNSGRGLILWGCGHDGMENKRVLDICHYHLDYFCDSDSSKVGTQIDGVQVISVDEMIKKKDEYAVIIGSRLYKDEMKEILLSNNFSKDNILYNDYAYCQAASDKCQYFDVFEPEEKEVFVDCGAYGGETILDFVKWTGGTYDKVIALEPLREMCISIENMCKEKGLKNIRIEEAAAWNKDEELLFKEDLAGSQISGEGEIAVHGMDLDSIIKQEKVTFIKMDIEGSELKALEGAQNIIRRDHPKLAISLYHKFEDIVELPLYILELNPEYKFYIRHYRSDVCETVLYATV